MASFGGTSFDERGGGGGTHFPYYGVKAALNVILIPGGAAVIQGGGMPPQSIELPIQCTTSQYAALRGKVGDQGTLVTEEGSTAAILDELSSPVRLLDGNDEYWQMTLKLLKVG